MTARWLSFSWSPERQEIACDGERFAHPVATNTSPTHDVAHLVAAASGLVWRPSGTRDEISFAEFNAVLLEHLGNRVLDVALFGRESAADALDRVLAHARWFVEAHYAPFPVTFEEALKRFRRTLDVPTAVRLAPVLFRTRIFELEHEDFRRLSFGASFSSEFQPTPSTLMRTARETLASCLLALETHRHHDVQVAS